MANRIDSILHLRLCSARQQLSRVHLWFHLKWLHARYIHISTCVITAHKTRSLAGTVWNIFVPSIVQGVVGNILDQYIIWG